MIELQITIQRPDLSTCSIRVRIITSVTFQFLDVLNQWLSTVSFDPFEIK